MQQPPPPYGAPWPGYRPRPPVWPWVMPLVSCGLLSWLAPIGVANRLKDSRARSWAVGFVIAFVASWVMSAGGDGSDTGYGMLLYFGTWFGSVAYGVSVAPRVGRAAQAASVPPVPVWDPNAAAIEHVKALRRRRDEARALAQQDPQMARDLRIGRPDLPRQYDDGGLVDVNSAPPDAIAQVLGLDAAQSEQVVATREQLDGFEHVDDLVNLVGLDPDDVDRVRDRIIVL